MTGFTDTYVMATAFLVVCVLASLLVPSRRVTAAPLADQEIAPLQEALAEQTSGS